MSAGSRTSLPHEDKSIIAVQLEHKAGALVACQAEGAARPVYGLLAAQCVAHCHTIWGLVPLWDSPAGSQRLAASGAFASQPTLPEVDGTACLPARPRARCELICIIRSRLQTYTNLRIANVKARHGSFIFIRLVPPKRIPVSLWAYRFLTSSKPQQFAISRLPPNFRVLCGPLVALLTHFNPWKAPRLFPISLYIYCIPLHSRAQSPDVQAAYVHAHPLARFRISVSQFFSSLFSSRDSALAKKQAGNQAYKSGNYSVATQLYSEAIGNHASSICPPLHVWFHCSHSPKILLL